MNRYIIVPLVPPRSQCETWWPYRVFLFIPPPPQTTLQESFEIDTITFPEIDDNGVEDDSLDLCSLDFGDEVDNLTVGG